MISQPVSLPVQTVAFTTLHHDPIETGERLLHPLLTVYVDCSALRDAGVPTGGARGSLVGETLRLVAVDAYRHEDNRAAVSLVLTLPSEQDQPDRPEWSIDVPATSIGLLTALSSTDAAIWLVLLDEDAPADPAFDLVDKNQISAFVTVPPTVVLPVLDGNVSESLTVPFGADDENDLAEAAANTTARSLLFPVFTGIALGQIPAWNQAERLGQWADSIIAGDTDQDDSDLDDADISRFNAFLTVCDYYLDSSSHTLDTHDLDVDLTVLPDRLRPLAHLIDTQVDRDCLAFLVANQNFAHAVAEHGATTALLALAYLSAVRADAVTDAAREFGMQAAWLSANWLTEEDEDIEPWWALLAVGPSLAHHDTAVLTDLMSVRPDGNDSEKIGPLLAEFLHILATALMTLNANDPQALRDALHNTDVKPRNWDDVTILADTLLTEARDVADLGDTDACIACPGITMLHVRNWDVRRTAAAAAGLMPVLADLNAAEEGFAVGEEDWVRNRWEFLSFWLTQAAS